MRVGSAEHKSFQNDLSTRWSQMSAESKAVFAAQAHDETQAKKAVAGKLLRFSGEHAKLSTSQSKTSWSAEIGPVIECYCWASVVESWFGFGKPCVSFEAWPCAGHQCRDGKGENPRGLWIQPRVP